MSLRHRGNKRLAQGSVPTSNRPASPPPPKGHPSLFQPLEWASSRAGRPEGPSLRGRPGQALSWLSTPHTSRPPLRRAGTDGEEALFAPHPQHPTRWHGRPMGCGSACSQPLRALTPATLSPAPGSSLLPPQFTPRGRSSRQPGWAPHWSLFTPLSAHGTRGWGTSKGAGEGPQHERSI